MSASVTTRYTETEWPAAWGESQPSPPSLDTLPSTEARIAGVPLYRDREGVRLPVGSIEAGVLTVPYVGRWCTVSVEREASSVHVDTGRGHA